MRHDRPPPGAAFYDGPTSEEDDVRPTTILSLLAGLLIGAVGVVVGVMLYVDRMGGYLWFYWVAPLLVLVFGLMMLNLLRQYWVRVGKLEVKGRPRRG
jgi:hypothetical protein